MIKLEKKLIYDHIFESKTITANNFLLLTKDKKILKFLQFYILSQEAKLKSIWGPTLTPLIGKEKITEFCNIFNKDTAILYENDIYIPVFFLLYDNKTFTYIIRTPTIFNIIKYIYDQDKLYRVKIVNKAIYYITIEELYYITCIKYSLYLYKNFIICLKNIIYILYKFNIKILL